MDSSQTETELIVIGGGIVGLAAAYQWTQTRSGARVVVLEKEFQLAQHQTGRNSGVLHSGIYYRPGSMKAKLCRDGKQSMEAFCESEGIPYDRCGKVIVATSRSEFGRLEAIFERGQENGITCDLINRDQLAELEPHAAGLKAIHVTDTGIVDYVAVARRLAERIREAGGLVITGAKFEELLERDHRGGLRIQTTAGEFCGERIANCSGLQVDRVSRRLGVEPSARIVPFRGEYFQLVESARHLCRGLIYPVPDPAFPFLGVHFTRMIDGSVECGPNAVLALAREGYTWGKINPRDVMDAVGYGGFLKLARRYWRTGAAEVLRSLSKAQFVKALQRLVPEIQSSDLVVAPAGIRAQALRPDGTLVDDFLIEHRGNITSVSNAPSPAATASLAIGQEIVQRILTQEPG